MASTLEDASPTSHFLASRPWHLALAHSWHAFAEAFALSLACSAVWKCHFYDRRRPRRSRRGLRELLRAHLLKCVAVATAVAAAPCGVRYSGGGCAAEVRSAFEPAEGFSDSNWAFGGAFVSARTLASWSFGATVKLQVDGGRLGCVEFEWWCRSGVCGALATCLLWLAAEVACEFGFHCARLGGSRLAAALCNFPLGENAGDRANCLQSMVKLFAMMVCVPGSAAPLLSAVARHAARGLPNSPLAVLASPFVAAYLFFVVFVKFAFIVFGLNTHCGFEDFDAPGWLLD
ncbi:hypothetical protein M885DRAFT_566106 [Pelagophyceae sp. CCMP2097]|nr:hypothetical protein M885DRAFT_566106 [Pelagophyceae sp. CCMP2097]